MYGLLPVVRLRLSPATAPVGGRPERDRPLAAGGVAVRAPACLAAACQTLRGVGDGAAVLPLRRHRATDPHHRGRPARQPPPAPGPGTLPPPPQLLRRQQPRLRGGRAYLRTRGCRYGGGRDARCRCGVGFLPGTAADAVRAATSFWSSVNRRDFLTGSGFAVSALTTPGTSRLVAPCEEAADPVGGRQVGRADLDGLREAADEARRWDSRYGGGNGKATSVTACPSERAAPAGFVAATHTMPEARTPESDGCWLLMGTALRVRRHQSSSMIDRRCSVNASSSAAPGFVCRRIPGTVRTRLGRRLGRGPSTQNVSCPRTGQVSRSCPRA